MNGDEQKALTKAQDKIAVLEQQLKEASRELEMLSYSISHDLRAPLRAIKGFSEALAEDYQARLDEDGKRYIEIITTSTNQIYRLIDGILNLSRLGRQEMHPSELDMQDIVQGLFVEVKAKHPERNVDFRLSPLPKAYGDPALIRQVWANLLDNAVKFTPRPEVIVEVAGEVRENENVYSVKDSGVGFDMKYAQKLFGLFQRFHTEKEFPGVGAGLAITQRLVRRHGGRIWAEAKLNEGATFYFSLPTK